MSTATKLPVEVLTRAELDALLRTCNRRSPSGLRDRALIALLYGSGIRIAEALALRPRDVDLDAGTVRVHQGKGSKARVSGIEEGMAAVVREWADHRARELGLNGTAPLFCQITKDRVGEPVQAGVRAPDAPPAGVTRRRREADPRARLPALARGEHGGRGAPAQRDPAAARALERRDHEPLHRPRAARRRCRRGAQSRVKWTRGVDKRQVDADGGQRSVDCRGVDNADSWSRTSTGFDALLPRVRGRDGLNTQLEAQPRCAWRSDRGAGSREAVAGSSRAANRQCRRWFVDRWPDWADARSNSTSLMEKEGGVGILFSLDYFSLSSGQVANVLLRLHLTDGSARPVGESGCGPRGHELAAWCCSLSCTGDSACGRIARSRSEPRSDRRGREAVLHSARSVARTPTTPVDFAGRRGVVSLSAARRTRQNRVIYFDRSAPLETGTRTRTRTRTSGERQAVRHVR